MFSFSQFVDFAKKEIFKSNDRNKYDNVTEEKQEQETNCSN